MTDLFEFSIAADSAEPLYRQLVSQVRRSVAGGQLKPGNELPSVRQLARALDVNPMTVSKAFSLLEADGLLERRRGRPMVVAGSHRHARTSGDRAELLRPTLERAAHEARQLQLSAVQALALFKAVLDERHRR